MKSAYLNDEFFSRLETLALNLRADLNGYFGGKHFVLSLIHISEPTRRS